MIYIHQNKKNKLPMNKEKMYIVADWDRTLTRGNSMTSWSILANKNMLPKEYIAQRQKYYEIYRPIEIDNSIDEKEKQQKMKEWYEKHINLFIKYKLKEELIAEASKDINIMQLRQGAKEFLKFLNDANIPLIIISAGIGNFIKCFLENNKCYYDNIYVSSNMLKFENGLAVGVEENIIHSLNKNEVSLPKKIKEKLKDRNQILLLGDQISDIKMIEDKKRENTIRTLFLNSETEKEFEEYKKYFDIILSDDESYMELKNVIL